MDRSFNRTDTSLSLNGGRIKLHSNMKRRCQRIVSALRALQGTGRTRFFMWEIVQKVQENDPTRTYSRGDVIYGIFRCLQDGTISAKPYGKIHMYSLTASK